MKLGALILSVGIFAMSFLADARQGSQAATPTCTTNAGVTTLHVSVLDAGYNPDVPFSAYRSPSADNSIVIANSAMATDLANAFNIAPLFFQQQLCGLDAVFINLDGCTSFISNVCANSLTDADVIARSWGFREQPKQFPPGAPPPQPPAPPNPGPTAPQIPHYGRFIAISAGPWRTATSHAPIYSAYEQKVLNELLTWPKPGSTVPIPPTYQGASPNDTPEMSILAALAHEFGHVLWYDTFRPVPGGSYDFNTFCRGTFFGNSWQHVDPPSVWHVFGEAQNEPKLYGNQIYDVKIADIALYLLRSKFSKVSNLLFRIYRPQGRWASLFGAFSPDEDFVETFKLYVLSNATSGNALTSLPLSIYSQPSPAPPAHTPDIPKDYNLGAKVELARKVNCFTQ